MGGVRWVGPFIASHEEAFSGPSDSFKPFLYMVWQAFEAESNGKQKNWACHNEVNHHFWSGHHFLNVAAMTEGAESVEATANALIKITPNLVSGENISPLPDADMIGAMAAFENTLILAHRRFHERKVFVRLEVIMRWIRGVCIFCGWRFQG